MAHFRILSEAKDDLHDIGLHTLQQWGKTQRDVYLKRLEKRFAWLAENPYLGKRRPEVHEDCHSFPEGRHVVYYLVSDDGIDIIGVLHGSMEVTRHFSYL